jgi:two-component system, NtrC family, sensor kinase
VLEATVDAAVVLDADRRILYYNTAYQVASGKRGRALALAAESGAKCHEILPLDVCETACVGCQARDAGRALRVELVGALHDGEVRTLTVTAAPLPGDMIIETYRDVTADIGIQRKYRSLLDQERRAKEDLAAELRRTHAQLIHQEKMSSLGRIVAGVAHELNNPINFVYGNVDFLGRYMEDLLSLIALYDQGVIDPAVRAAIEDKKQRIEFEFLVEDSRKLLRSIRAGAERTAGIVRDLKTFSRNVSGAMQETDLVIGIETTLNLIAPLLKGRIVVQRDFEEPHPQVVCHPGHLNQVFMNILTNAAQAIDGEGQINVTLRSAPGDTVEVVVKDTGPGIAAEDMPQIFDPFFTTKDVGEGTGLGLAISESVVRAHGGHISCVSSPGQGAQFTVTLPRRPPLEASE